MSLLLQGGIKLHKDFNTLVCKCLDTMEIKKQNTASEFFTDSDRIVEDIKIMS
jgi:hypothetical protein